MPCSAYGYTRRLLVHLENGLTALNLSRELRAATYVVCVRAVDCHETLRATSQYVSPSHSTKIRLGLTSALYCSSPSSTHLFAFVLIVQRLQNTTLPHTTAVARNIMFWVCASLSPTGTSRTTHALEYHTVSGTTPSGFFVRHTHCSRKLAHPRYYRLCSLALD